MPHEIDLIITLSGGLTVAVLCAYITTRLGLSPIVGYLVAGLALSNQTPGLAVDQAMASQMAEVGVILLMFGVGLQFHLKELLAVKGVAIPGAIVQIAVATGLGALTVHFFDWSWSAGVVFGLAISVASTVVLTRILSDNNALHTRAGHIAIGWLVVEDIFTVLVLVLLPEFTRPSEGSMLMDLGTDVLLALGKLALLLLLTFVVGKRLVPKLLSYIALTGSRELFTLSVLVLALGIAVGTAFLFGASMALGAFLAGMIVGQSEFCNRAATEALPFRDAFAVLFFVSVGMLFDPTQFMSDWQLIALTTLVILIGKPIAALIVVRILGYPFRVGLTIAVALAQIGEFSFILATMATDLNVIPASALNILVAASIVSITLNPLYYRLIDPLVWCVDHAPWMRWLFEPISTTADHSQVQLNRDEEHHAVVVGFGPVGRTVARLLSKNGIRPVIIELNLETVHHLKERGMSVVYGEAGRRETLEVAGVADAEAFILTSSTVAHSNEAIRIDKELNPQIRILARANYLKELPELSRAGAGRVVTAEGEVALAMTEYLLLQLGATFEQVDRERRQVREDLFEVPA